jgi:hypothetical protein
LSRYQEAPMSIGTVLVLLGVILAVVSLFTGPAALLAAAVICIGIGVLVGASALVR